MSWFATFFCITVVGVEAAAAICYALDGQLLVATGLALMCVGASGLLRHRAPAGKRRRP